MKNKKNKFLFILLGLTLLFSSCSEWLNVSPKSNMKAEDMFKSENGFRDALIGVYSLMATNNLYGANLSYSFTDVLAQYYTSPNEPSVGGYDHSYKSIVLYKYTDPTVRWRINEIWGTAYKAIANTNQALEFIDINRGAFVSEDVYNIFKGEFFALRAMIHFDLLRLFAASPKMMSENLALPYFTTFTNKPQPQLTFDEFINKVISDLTIAKKIMAGSDTFGPNSNPNNEKNEHFLNRKYRLNYYAVTALLSRVYLYAGQNENALNQAKEIIGEPNDEPQFFKLSNIASSETNPMFESEIMFASNIELLHKNIEGTLTEEDVSSSILTVSQKGYTNLFSAKGTSLDFRITWLMPTSKGNTFIVNKYTKSVYIPLIKLSELYLIAAETSTGSNAEGYLNRIRSHRGISPLTSENDFKKELLNEYRREFIGEGQLFYFYKRNTYGMIGLEDNVPVEDYNKIYVLPIPLQEKESGNIKN